MSDLTTYRIVDADPEYGEYLDLTENKYQPLPDGVLRWCSGRHYRGDSPNGYLVPTNSVPDDSLQSITDVWGDAHLEWWQKDIREEVRRGWPQLAYLLDVLIEEDEEKTDE